jgi:segregation and condensation protein A
MRGPSPRPAIHTRSRAWFEVFRVTALNCLAMEITDPGSQYSVKVPVFEGPLDLLLHLIKENKIDIYDIPISVITSQYLEYLELMKELNLEIASEFLVIAATLIYIKSRMLLPKDETVETEEGEDPRAGLVQRLLEYQAFKEASGELRQREEVWSGAYARPPLEIDKSKFEPELELYLFEVHLFDLVGALNKILSKAPPEEVRITKETLTVKDRIAAILDRVEQEKTVRFEMLFEEDNRRVHIIVTFLALLEILRLGILRVFQDRQFDTIWIIKPEETAETNAPVTQGELPV